MTCFLYPFFSLVKSMSSFVVRFQIDFHLLITNNVCTTYYLSCNMQDKKPPWHSLLCFSTCRSQQVISLNAIIRNSLTDGSDRSYGSCLFLDTSHKNISCLVAADHMRIKMAEKLVLLVAECF